MESSHLIAQVLGLIYTVVAIGILINTQRFAKVYNDLMGNSALLYFGGVASLTVGYLIITFGPNMWTVSFEGLITLIGWIALVKGAVLVISPDAIKGVAGFWMKNMQLAGGVVLILGLLIGYYGFAM